MPGTHVVDYSCAFDVASFRRNYLCLALRALDTADMRFHDPRHMYSSLMLAAGFPPYAVSRGLGHANLSTTDSIYAHLYPSDYASHVNRFEAAITRGL